ncbi:MAG: serine/threonine-protein kinase, partial [Chloroflexota bacterium]
MNILPEDTILENRYRIDGVLAQGHLGATYRGFDTRLNTPVAIKAFSLSTPIAVNQFKQEALILSGLRHPSLPSVLQNFSWNEQQYLVMEFLEGPNLWELITQNSQFLLPERQALDYVSQISQAVSYLHNQTPPISHGDIKPQNIKLAPSGQTVLVGYHLMHTDRDPVRKDLNALGQTLYALLTTQIPSENPNPIPSLNPRVSEATTKLVTQVLTSEPQSEPLTVDVWHQKLKS